ncbi:Ger(x)C family spore germination protein [Paenibacillus xylanexedens]|uniref:Ger(x)C family spore germination protein n=1 Tax=Paenibacillus xylanexedens TaxID=528191 RepID=UPI001EFF7A5D|nr:Ger(x)C family spore germination protein [Paenibacillus xylanexedens]MCF7755292.1 Ger(x)C family spore germination protein [Paenibacillus xylanexedens]
MIFRRPPLPLMVVIISCLLCTGCWSKVEINERTFITAMYVDKADTPGEIEVTLSMPLPNRLSPEGGGTGKDPYAAVSATAPTITDAIERIQTDLTRKISWGHTRVIVFGQAYAREGIEDTMEWIARQPLFHLSSYVMVANGRAKDVSDLTPVFEETPSDVLREFSTEENLLKTQVLSIFTSDKMNQGFASSMLGSKQTNMLSEEGESKKWVSQIGGSIFSQMRMVGTLSADEARAVAWAGQNLDSMTISVRTKKQKASMKLYRMHSDIHVKLLNGEPHFVINLTGRAELNSVIPVLKAEDIVGIKDIEQAANEKVSAHLTQAIQTAKHQGSDILMLGYRLEWRYPKVWKKLRPTWINYVKNDLQFTVNTNINIQFVGSESSF